jgi:excinuclease UvrABC nuclease subunit
MDLQKGNLLMKVISIDFQGYWTEDISSGIPSRSGVYCVYECTNNSQENTVAIHRLIYIGESENVNSRIANHEKKPRWQRYVSQGNELCYSMGPVSSTDRVRAEAALIFKHKPPVNTECLNNFPYEDTNIVLTGKTAMLTNNFTVRRT